MVEIKINEAKVSAKSMTLKVKNCLITDGKLVDDDGLNVISQIEEALPEGVDRVSFNIKVELPEEE